MKRGKLIHCRTHDPIGVGRQYRVGWSDVWIRWAGKGRSVEKLGPTLCSFPEVKADLIMDEQCQKDNPGLDFSEDIENTRRMVEDVERQGFAHSGPHKNGIPTLATKSDFIDRAEAERMLRWYMRDVYGFDNVRFKWKRVKAKNAIMPFSFAYVAERSL